MTSRGAGLLLGILALAGSPAVAGSHGAGGHTSSGIASQSLTLGAVSQSYYGPVLFRGPAVYAWGPYGQVLLPPPPLVLTIGAGGFPQPVPLVSPIPYAPPQLPYTPLQPRVPVAEQVPRVEPRRPRRTGNPAKAAELVTVGDRLFRAGNLPRAQFRYEQAVEAHPNSAAARVRLAEIALVRGQYAEAAERLREAQTAEPGWIEHASDIQGLFPEPTKFAAEIARIEAHLQRQPDDRDAWLMLGVQWFLSGRTQLASDVFLRLDDPSEAPDETLQAFLDASKTK